MRFYRTIIRPRVGFFVSINVKKAPIVEEHRVNHAFLYHKTVQFAQIAYP
jgi:hypothetical protein